MTTTELPANHPHYRASNYPDDWPPLMIAADIALRDAIEQAGGRPYSLRRIPAPYLARTTKPGHGLHHLLTAAAAAHNSERSALAAAATILDAQGIRASTATIRRWKERLLND